MDQEAEAGEDRLNARDRLDRHGRREGEEPELLILRSANLNLGAVELDTALELLVEALGHCSQGRQCEDPDDDPRDG